VERVLRIPPAVEVLLARSPPSSSSSEEDESRLGLLRLRSRMGQSRILALTSAKLRKAGCGVGEGARWNWERFKVCEGWWPLTVCRLVRSGLGELELAELDELVRAFFALWRGDFISGGSRVESSHRRSPKVLFFQNGTGKTGEHKTPPRPVTRAACESSQVMHLDARPFRRLDTRLTPRLTHSWRIRVCACGCWS
jgi:hypothetical protein